VVVLHFNIGTVKTASTLIKRAFLSLECIELRFVNGKLFLDNLPTILEASTIHTFMTIRIIFID